jgi:PleD family two-component response regulator
VNVVDRIREAAGELGPSFSWGLAQLRPGDTVEALLRRADEAMYRRKRRQTR